MTEEYIDKHYDLIIGHESDIESRMTEGDCTAEELKKCNRWFIDSFTAAGENVVLIEDDFESATAGLF
jgi:hypothetical protein